MKKILDSKLFVAILTAVFCATISVGATAIYNSSEIGFTPANSNWKVNNLESAINDLYTAQNSVRDNVNYSTTEQVIGTWLNETLYQKVVAVTIPTTSTPQVVQAHGITGLKRAVNITGYWYNSQNSYSFPMPRATWNESSKTGKDTFDIFVDPTNIYVSSASGISTSYVNEIYVILQYTKTE